MRTLHAALSLVGPPFLNLLLFLSPAGPGKLGLTQPPRGPPPARSEVRSQAVGAEALSALGEAGRRQASQGGGKKGPKPEGVRELASPQLASCEAGRITGKLLGLAEMSGPREQADGRGGDVGHGCSRPQRCWVESLAWAQAWPGHPHATTPRPPSGEKRGCWLRRGPPSPPEGAWASTQPSRWLGRRPAGPSSAPQPDTRVRNGLFCLPRGS